MNERRLQDALRDILERLLEAHDDDVDDDLSDLAEAVGGLRRLRTFDEAGLLTHDKGLVLEMDDGSEFQVTIVQRAPAGR